MYTIFYVKTGAESDNDLFANGAIVLLSLLILFLVAAVCCLFGLVFGYLAAKFRDSKRGASMQEVDNI